MVSLHHFWVSSFLFFPLFELLSNVRYFISTKFSLFIISYIAMSLESVNLKNVTASVLCFDGNKWRCQVRNDMFWKENECLIERHLKRMKPVRRFDWFNASFSVLSRKICPKSAQSLEKLKVEAFFGYFSYCGFDLKHHYTHFCLLIQI